MSKLFFEERKLGEHHHQSWEGTAIHVSQRLDVAKYNKDALTELYRRQYKLRYNCEFSKKKKIETKTKLWIIEEVPKELWCSSAPSEVSRIWRAVGRYPRPVRHPGDGRRRCSGCSSFCVHERSPQVSSSSSLEELLPSEMSAFHCWMTGCWSSADGDHCWGRNRCSAPGLEGWRIEQGGHLKTENLVGDDVTDSSAWDGDGDDEVVHSHFPMTSGSEWGTHQSRQCPSSLLSFRWRPGW